MHAPDGISTANDSPQLVEALRARGVVVHAPQATTLLEIVPEQFEPGVELFPGCVIRGAGTRLGRGTRLGIAGGGYFENVVTGRGVELYGGYFVDAVFLDGVIARGYAEMRGGTVMEEHSEVGHHVGFKMTVTLPNVVAGSLINFCDALVAGGTSRKDHSEIGSCLALYNFTPWGDKFASLFGDVPSGVLLRSPRIFVGGQAQIVSPVSVGYGALIPAGAAIRRSVPAGRMRAETTPPSDDAFDPDMYGGLLPKFELTAQFVGNLWALLAWYRHVRLPWASEDPFLGEVYEAAIAQLQAGIDERIKRLDRIVSRLPASRALHERYLAQRPGSGHEKRIAEHDFIVAHWPAWRAGLRAPATVPGALSDVVDAMASARQRRPGTTYLDAVGGLPDALLEPVRAALQAVVDSVRLDGR